jgi:hypothetical protein
MIDLVIVAALFFEASKEWREPQDVRIHPLSAIEHEPIYQRLKANGHEMSWAKDTKVRQLAREGWRPVTERDSIRRPIVFMDRDGEQMLMHRAGQ